MKTTTQFFSLMIALAIISMTGTANAQGRGHQKARERHGVDHHDRTDHDRKRDWHEKKHHKHDRDHHYHGTREVRVVHHHPYPVVVRHFHERPRYIYYRDYDVYYDYHRNVYISYSGRNWAVSASLPAVMHRVDTRRAVRMEVDYDRDDFHIYLQRSRPSFRRVYIGS
jgi:hypothetical protein